MSDKIDGLKLYEVEIAYTIYVLAEDQMDAEMNAPGYLRDEGGDPAVFAHAVKPGRKFPADIGESLPHWENDGDPPTVAEAIAIISAREKEPTS